MKKKGFWTSAGVYFFCRETLKTNELKGLGHAILGNFSTDQMVIELTEI